MQKHSMFSLGFRIMTPDGRVFLLISFCLQNLTVTFSGSYLTWDQCSWTCHIAVAQLENEVGRHDAKKKEAVT